MALLRTGRLDAAIADFDAALSQHRYDADALRPRAGPPAQGRRGGGAADIAAAKELDGRIDTRLGDYGLR